MNFSRALIFPSLLLMNSSVFAESIPIEADAIISEENQAGLFSASALGNIVQMEGYNCKSISSARPLFSDRGFYLRCNGFADAYILRMHNRNGKLFLVIPD